jgi:hypothetical protein
MSVWTSAIRPGHEQRRGAEPGAELLDVRAASKSACVRTIR